MDEAMKGRVPQRYARGRGMGLLWFGVLAGPLAWLIDLTARYALVQTACPQRVMLWVHAIMLGAMALAGAGIWVGWRNWQQAGAHWPSEEGGVIGRSRFLAMAGILTGSFFFLFIVAQAVPTLFLEPCR